MGLYEYTHDKRISKNYVLALHKVAAGTLDHEGLKLKSRSIFRNVSYLLRKLYFIIQNWNGIVKYLPGCIEDWESIPLFIIITSSWPRETTAFILALWSNSRIFVCYKWKRNKVLWWSFKISVVIHLLVSQWVKSLVPEWGIKPQSLTQGSHTLIKTNCPVFSLCDRIGYHCHSGLKFSALM